MNHLTCNLYLIFILSFACFPCLFHQSGIVKEAFQMAFVFTKGQRQIGKSIKIQPVVKEGVVMQFPSVHSFVYWTDLSER